MLSHLSHLCMACSEEGGSPLWGGSGIPTSKGPHELSQGSDLEVFQLGDGNNHKLPLPGEGGGKLNTAEGPHETLEVGIAQRGIVLEAVHDLSIVLGHPGSRGLKVHHNTRVDDGDEIKG